MKKPRLADVLAASLSVLAVAAGALGQYLGTIAALVGLTGLLTARTLAGRSELPVWTVQPPQTRGVAVSGPIYRMTTQIREAADGDRYYRTELSILLSWLASAKKGDLESPSDRTSANRILLAGSRDPAAKVVGESDSPIVSSRLRGKGFVAMLQGEVESMADG